MPAVIKLGGSILGEGVDSGLLADLVELAREEAMILVHGGGDEVTAIAERLGKKQTFVVSPDGIRSRYTDRETAEIFTMVMAGRLGKQIVATLQAHGAPAIGLSGVDAGLLRAERKKRLVVVDERGRKRAIEGGYTGKITHVNTALLDLLLKARFIPVLSPVAAGDSFEFLNVDGDRAAAYVAGSMRAHHVIFLTDVEGVLDDGHVISRLTLAQAEALRPKLGHGMEKKVLAAIEALRLGAECSMIASGLGERPLTRALREGRCTEIRP